MLGWSSSLSSFASLLRDSKSPFPSFRRSTTFTADFWPSAFLVALLTTENAPLPSSSAKRRSKRGRVVLQALQQKV